MSLRTKYAVIASHREYLDRLAHFEGLVSCMLVCECRMDGSHPSLMVGMEPSDVDFQFLERQVHKIAIAINDHRKSWATTADSYRASGIDHIVAYNAHPPTHVFPTTLRPCLSIIRELNDNSRTMPPKLSLTRRETFAKLYASMGTTLDPCLRAMQADPYHTRPLADFSPWSTGQPVKTAKKFYASQRLFEENREREALEAAGDDIDSDGERQIECSDNEDANDGPIAPAPAPAVSAWDEPLSPLSSVPPSPTLSASSLPSTSLPPDPQDAAREKEKRIQELTARWDGQPGVAQRHRRACQPMETGLASPSLPVASTGWVGLRDKKPDRSLYSAQELVEKLGFELIGWDGQTTVPILDSAGSVVSVLLGQPNDLTWADAGRNNRRGPFPAAAIGISYGGGQKKPGNLCDGGDAVQRVLHLLIKNKGI
ncbi:hypothetical protein HGRIS_003276 [Hohenbuehelia grisea]|uniref:Uncharacterized protein n=1 Tax=Hohenbuehelia grisea TaxID=104357 RepID=A0ABR3JMY3_9AGAR